MGMDVYGKKPMSEKGEYFRNNVWWWHPLADYCVHVASDICEACQYWHSNDGCGLDAEDAMQLAEILQGELDSGNCDAYAKHISARWICCPRNHVRFVAVPENGCHLRKRAPGIRSATDAMAPASENR